MKSKDTATATERGEHSPNEQPVVYMTKKEAGLQIASLPLVDPIGIEPTTLRMRTVRSCGVVSFLPTDCGMWGAYIM